MEGSFLHKFTIIIERNQENVNRNVKKNVKCKRRCKAFRRGIKV